MRMITINVDEKVYDSFRKESERRQVSTSKLIRDAMAEYEAQKIREPRSIFDHEPASVGRVLRELTTEDDLLGEMLGDRD